MPALNHRPRVRLLRAAWGAVVDVTRAWLIGTGRYVKELGFIAHSTWGNL